MRGLAGAWLVGEALVIWRQVHGHGRLPVPGQLLAVTGLFAGLALVGDLAPRSAGLVTAVAWGLDVAGVLSLWGQGLGGQVSAAAATGTGGKTAAGSGGQNLGQQAAGLFGQVGQGGF